jgi:general secretion pathway protein C
MTTLPTEFPASHDNVGTMVSRILALLVWALAAASVVFWGLRWFAKPVAVPPTASSVAMNSAPAGDLSKLWTGPALAASAVEVPAAPELASRIQMAGALAPREGSSGGIALLTVDGRPSQAFKPGQVIEGDNIVQSIGSEGVKIGPRGADPVLTLPLPTMPAAATGTLPPPATVGMAAPAMASPAAPMPYQAEVGMAANAVEGADVPPTRNRRLPPRMRRGMVGGPPGGSNTDVQQPES